MSRTQLEFGLGWGVDSVVGQTHGTLVLVADGAVAVQVDVAGETTLTSSDERLERIVARRLPLFRAPQRSEPVGRDRYVVGVFDSLAAGRSAQLVGPEGSGRREVASTVVRRLAAAGAAGAWLLEGAQAHTLDSLYTRLAGLFFDIRWHEPDESVLRELTRRLHPGGVLVVTDCELPAAEVARLLESFPDCLFLLTSSTATLGGLGAVHELDPLSLHQACELVRRTLGRALRENEERQTRHAYELARGRVAPLVTFAAFLRRVADDPRHTDLVDLPPAQQEAYIVSGLEAGEQRLLRALSAFGAAPLELLSILAGTEIDAAATVSRLAAAGLVREVDAGFTASAGAAAAVGVQVPAQESSRIGEELYRVYLAPGQAPRPPAPLALAVVQALVTTAQAWDLASRLARVAAADAVAAGRVPVWSKLVALGAQAAKAAGRHDDQLYFLRQQHTGALLRNDAAAAAAITAALAELLRLSPPAPAPSPARLSRSPKARPRSASRAMSGIKHVATAGHGAGGVAAAVVAAAVAGGAVGALQGSGPPSGPQAATAGSAISTSAQAWAITTSPKPLSPLSAAGVTLTAQYPLLAAGASGARQASVDALLQQPLREEFADLESHAKASLLTGNLGDSATEKTTAHQAGALESVVYDFGETDTDFVSQVAAISLVLRTDTGAVLPQSQILTPQAQSGVGAARLNALVNSLLPASTSAQTSVAAVGCRQPFDGADVSPAIAVTATGLTFYVSTNVYTCDGDTPVAVPFDRLDGLVNPLVEQLASISRLTTAGAP